MNYRTVIQVGGRRVATLADIVPETKRMTMLIIGKVPIPESVERGHYFQGSQGQTFWRMLKEYGVLRPAPDRFEDETLIEHDYGITDVLKLPRPFHGEPAPSEYRAGTGRIMEIIRSHRPAVTLWVYKGALDGLLRHGLRVSERSSYGFNAHLSHYFRAKVFVFPMPGTPCPRHTMVRVMEELAREIGKLHNARAPRQPTSPRAIRRATLKAKHSALASDVLAVLAAPRFRRVETFLRLRPREDGRVRWEVATLPASDPRSDAAVYLRSRIPQIAALPDTSQQRALLRALETADRHLNRGDVSPLLAAAPIPAQVRTPMKAVRVFRGGLPSLGRRRR